MIGMYKIDEPELKEIIDSYELNDLVFDTFSWEVVSLETTWTGRDPYPAGFYIYYI